MNSAMQTKLVNHQVSYAKKGFVTALISAVFWGLNGVMLGFASMFDPFVIAASIFVASIVQAALHDGFAAIWVFLYNLKNGKVKEYLRVLNTRPGKMICIGGIFGGPVAMTGYILGINMAGAAYAMPITALCPCVGALLAAVFLKEKIIPRVWVGIVLAVLGVIIVSYVPPEGTTPETFYLGLALASLAAFGWGFEGMLGAYGTDLIDPNLATGLKYISSFAVYVIVVVPIASAFPFMIEAVLSVKAMLVLALTASTAAACYVLWYKALNMTGVGRTMALNDTYVLWGLFFSWLLSKFGLMEFSLTPTLVIGAFVVVAGVILVVSKPSDMLNLRNN